MQQRTLERCAVFMLWAFMLLVAVSFATGTGSIAVLSKFATDTRVYIDQGFFAVGAFISTLYLPLLLLPSLIPVRSFWKRVLFVYAGFPLAAYTVPLGYYAWSAGISPLSVIICVWIYLFICLTGFAVYRLRGG